MPKKNLLIVGILCLVFLGAGFVLGKTLFFPQTSSQALPLNQPAAQNILNENENAIARADTTNVNGTQPIIHHVDILADRISPNELVVPVGDYVQFDTKDGQQHNMAQGDGHDLAHGHMMHDGDEPQSGIFGEGEAYKVTFTKTGLYVFHDQLHPDLNVAILVFDPAKEKEAPKNANVK